VSADVPDGELARLARGGDPVAFRLLVERHQPMVRARARQLTPDPGDVDDIVQESFLQAFLALDRLRDPDRFAGWLSGIVLNVCRSLHRRAPLTLLADWPEPLHPTSAGGLPSAEDLDRADAVRAAVAPRSPSAASSVSRRPRASPGCSCESRSRATFTGRSPRRPPWPTQPTTSSPSKVPAPGPPTGSPRRSRTTPTPWCSASSWPGPSGSSCATRSSPGLGWRINGVRSGQSISSKSMSRAR